MNRLTKILYFILMLVVAALVTTYVLQIVVTQPGKIILEMGGDSMKNYYSFIQHAMFGEGFKFSGMNYPYGENIIYADGQPLLSILLQKVGISTPESALIVIHITMAIGMFLCIVYNYKILRHYKVHSLVAMLTASLIAIMSPQIFRVLGHFGLSYMCMVPMMFYWSIKYNDKGSLLYIFFIIIAGLFFSLLHPYLAAIITIWCIFYAIAYLITTKGNWSGKLRHVAPILATAALIMVFVKLVLVYTDPITDRSTHPYGMFSGCTTYLTLFSSNISPIWKAILGDGNYGDSLSEGYGYPGLVVLIISFVAAITIIIRLLKGKQALSISADVGFKPIWLVLALLAVILAHGAPLIWVKSSIDYIAALRQFRSMGRFVWLFYYIATIYAVVLMYRYYITAKSRNYKISYVALLGISIIVWGIEAAAQINYIHKRELVADYNYYYIINPEKDRIRGWGQFLEDKGYRVSDFQAIVGLPYYHIGSEKIWLQKENAWMATLTMQAALQLHLPIMNVHMSRTSWSQTFSQVRLTSGLYSSKEVLDALPNNKLILVLYTDRVNLSDETHLLLNTADSLGLYDDEAITVYALDPLKLKQACDSAVNNALSIAKTIKGSSKDTCIDCYDRAYIVDHFEEINAPQTLAGSGAFMSDMQPGNEILRSYDLKPSDDTAVLYELSCWAKVSEDEYNSPTLKADLIDTAGKYIRTLFLHGSWSRDMYGQLWFRMSEEFVKKPNVRGVNIYLSEQEEKNYIALDELQIRPVDALIVSKVQQGDSITVLANNHIISSKK